MQNDTPVQMLPDTATLLVSGGDTRIVLDPVTGVSVYGCRPWPDPELVALGSSTASVISEAGIAAAHVLRETCSEQLQDQPPAEVYALHTARLRAELLSACGLAPSAGVDAVLAASGTDLHLLVTQWLRPQRTVMITPTETGSGVPAALQGQHFNRRSACGEAVPIGTPVSDWQGDLYTLAARAADGSLRNCDEIDAECTALVTQAVAAGQRVLLVLTDVSKTGLIVPSIATTLALKRSWPTQVEVLVDACQFRLATETIRAYLTRDFLVALTGSKFMSGPTFCGALLVPPAAAARYRHTALGRGAYAYSNAADWPSDWAASRSLPVTANFGLLLRWEAAMTELRAFFDVPESFITNFLQRFAEIIRERMAHSTCLEALPVATLDRQTLGLTGYWDHAQTIFPFLLHAPDGQDGKRLLSREETDRFYQHLRNPATDSTARRFQLGQPVPCGHRDGIPVSALRLCVSAPMVVAAYRGAGIDAVLGNLTAALDQITLIASAL